MKTIDLKAHLQLDMALGEVLQKRRTNRDCQSKQLDEEVLSTLLWACAGITDEDGRRTVPSTMDLRAVTSYVLRADGAWRYNAAQNCLEQTTDKDVREVSTVRQFDYVKTAPVTIVFVADKERSKTARPTGVYVDAGTMGQNCYLVATAMGLAGCIRASFDHEELRKAMNLTEYLEPILLFTVGYPK